MMRTRIAFLFFLAPALFAFQGAPTRVNISLNTTGSAPEVVVSPDRVTLGLGGKVLWVSSGDRRDHIEINFQSRYGKAGPFPADHSQGNPRRGRYRKGVGSPILTAGATDKGDWKYTVTWVTAAGTRYQKDPVIIIR